MVSLLAAALTMMLLAVAEWLHARRVRRVAWLAFGPAGSPSAWTAIAPLLRVASAGALAWGFVTLLQIGNAPLEDKESGDPRALHHVVVAIDVSPSMDLPDAGPNEDQSRGERAREVIRSVLERLDSPHARTSIIAFYTNARPVVIDTFDLEVTANVLADLPLEHAFAAGKTDLYSGVGEAARLGATWRERSATLVVISDGDTLPSQDIPDLPRSYSRVFVLGVGSLHRGVFIDGHSSRQDAQSLERLALRLGGRYYNTTARHVPGAAVLEAAALAAPPVEKGAIDERRLAVAAVCGGSLALAVLPLLLAVAGGQVRSPAATVSTLKTSPSPRSRELLESGA